MDPVDNPIPSVAVSSTLSDKPTELVEESTVDSTESQENDSRESGGKVNAGKSAKQSRKKGINCAECPICHKSLDKSYIARHLVWIHDEKPFACKVCGEKFSTGPDHQEHLVTHSREERWPGPTCPHCGKKLASKVSLKYHIRHVHQRKFPYECHICNRGFRNKKSLKDHGFQHTGESPYQCDICCKKFQNAWHLATHKKVHQAQRQKLKCDVCLKEFSQKTGLVTHMKLHTEEPCFECVHCRKKFRMKQHLATHLRFVHGEEAQVERDYRYECDVCHKRFYSKWNLKTHLAAHAKGSI